MKDSFYNQWFWGKKNIHMQKSEVGPLPNPIYRNELKIEHINVRVQSIKLSKKHRVKLYDFGFGSDFSHMTSKA